MDAKRVEAIIKNKIKDCNIDFLKDSQCDTSLVAFLNTFKNKKIMRKFINHASKQVKKLTRGVNV